jgi:hypothetical protein
MFNWFNVLEQRLPRMPLKAEWSIVQKNNKEEGKKFERDSMMGGKERARRGWSN